MSDPTTSPSGDQPTGRDPVSHVRALVAPVLAPRELDLWDVEYAGGVVRVLIDRPGGVDLEAIGEVTRQVSAALDESDPIPGRYTLEVSSPGLERTLRTPEHFARTVGDRVSLKTAAGTEGDRRCVGTLVAADEAGVTVRLDDDAERRLAHHEIERARTVFEWGPTPKPGGASRGQKRTKAHDGATSRNNTTTSTTKAASR